MGSTVKLDIPRLKVLIMQFRIRSFIMVGSENWGRCVVRILGRNPLGVYRLLVSASTLNSISTRRPKFIVTTQCCPDDH